jgi:hypothetical protein
MVRQTNILNRRIVPEPHLAALSNSQFDQDE